MILFLDAHYAENYAAGAGWLCSGWEHCESGEELVQVIQNPKAYVPGSFFERELPCILPLVREVLERGKLETIVVDGYVDLGADRPGLGRRLWKEIGDPEVEVIGVAKSAFAGAPAEPVLRGDASRPLWVTSTADTKRAAQRIQDLPGPFRIPDVLRRVDALAREAIAGL